MDIVADIVPRFIKMRLLPNEVGDIEDEESHR